MNHDWEITLAEANDQQLRDALAQAHIPALMGTLVHLRGNTDHFAEVRPVFELFGEEEDGLEEAQREQIRELAFISLTEYRDAGCPEIRAPSEADVVATMHAITGEPMQDEHIPLLREELNLFGEDRRRVPIDTSQLDDDFRVLIIGSGMSGILAAIRLQQEGIPFQIVEKNPEIGGTWYENTYPGCQVDSVNHVYNYLFEPNLEWPGYFSGRKDLFLYFEKIVEKYGLREHILFNTQVAACRYDESANDWQVSMVSDGESTTSRYNCVISAVGQLNVPRMPEIEGVGSFSGPAFHSARWEHEHDLTGKRVIVIGTGCSAAQFVPEIAPLAGNLEVFQRTPPWLLPTDTYHQALSQEELWLFREIPFYARWFRFFLFRSRGVDGYLPLLYSQDDWQGPEGTISEGNEQLRAALLEALAEEVGGDNELLQKLTPNYPPGGKRPVLDDGSYLKSLQRDNVQLQTEPIARIVPEGVVTEDGELHPADVLIYGTGFQADQFLTTTTVYGRNGRELVSEWGGNPSAYKGVVVPDFPNFYCLYGPNTNIVVGSSIVFSAGIRQSHRLTEPAAGLG
jgi:4-hydroxyacetophenone monooxygenase